MSVCHPETVERKLLKMWKILFYSMGGLEVQAELWVCLCCETGPGAGSLILLQNTEQCYSTVVLSLRTLSITVPWGCGSATLA